MSAADTFPFNRAPKSFRMRLATSLFILTFAGNVHALTFDWLSTVQAGGGATRGWVVSDNSGNVFSTAFAGSGFIVDPGGALCCWDWGRGPYVYKLTEDRGFAWTALLASQSLTAGGVATDASGNVYMAGATNFNFATAVPGTGEPIYPPYGPGALIWKMNPEGASIWLRQLATSPTSWGTNLKGLSVRSDGSIIAAGSFFQSIDLDPGVGNVSLTSLGESDLFVVALDAQGNFLWGRQFGGANEESISSMVAGPSGDILLIGEFSDTFPLPDNASQLVSAGNGDGFALHLNANGVLMWAGQVGGQGNDRLNDAAFDPDGNILLTGSFSIQADLDPSSSVSMANSAGLADGFVAMVDASHALIWKRQLGGPGEDRSQAVIFGSGCLYVGGTFSQTANFGAPAGSVTASGADDGYVLKLDREGGFQNFHPFGGESVIPDNDPVYDLFMDRTGALLVTGGFTKIVDFDPDPDTSYEGVNFSEWADAYTLRLNDQGAIRVQPSFEPAIVSVGENSRLKLLISNSLTETNLDAISLNQALPSAWRISPDVAPNSTCAGNIVANPDNTNFALVDGALSAGESCQVDVSVRSASTGPFTIVVEPSMFSANQDIWPLSTTIATVTVERAVSALFVDSVLPSPSMPGESVEFRAHVSVPWGELLEATGEIEVDDGSQSCVIVLPGNACSMTFTTLGSREITFNYLGDSKFLPSTEITTHNVYAFTDLSLSLEHYPTHIQDGGTFAFDILVHNAGPFDAAGALLSLASKGYTVLSWQCVKGCAKSYNGDTIDPLSIEADAEIRLRVNAQADSNIDEIEITASIEIFEPFNDANPSNNTATHSAASVLFFDSFEP